MVCWGEGQESGGSEGDWRIKLDPRNWENHELMFLEKKRQNPIFANSEVGDGRDCCSL